MFQNFNFFFILADSRHDLVRGAKSCFAGTDPEEHYDALFNAIDPEGYLVDGLPPEIVRSDWERSHEVSIIKCPKTFTRQCIIACVQLSSFLSSVAIIFSVIISLFEHVSVILPSSVGK